MSARKKYGTPKSGSTGNLRSPGRSAQRIGLAIKFVGYALIAILIVTAWHLARNRKQASPPAAASLPKALDGNTATASASAANYDPAFVSEVNRGNELLSQGKPAEAAEVLAGAARMNPDDEDVHYNLGLALARLGKYDDAIREYQEALKIFPVTPRPTTTWVTCSCATTAWMKPSTTSSARSS
jgi:tetratricopeptide (TPR) repeat protein